MDSRHYAKYEQNSDNTGYDMMAKWDVSFRAHFFAPKRDQGFLRLVKVEEK